MRKLIYTLFVIQTLLLCTAYTLEYIVSIDLYGWDVIPSIIAIRKKGWHKVLNVLCLEMASKTMAGEDVRQF